MRKWIIIFIIIITALGITWGVMNRESIKTGFQTIKEKVLERFPVLKKVFGPKEKPKEEKKPKKPEVLEVKGFKVAQIHFTDTLPAVGTLKAIREIRLRFEVNGRIGSFNFREGDLIEEGDIIAELDHNDARLKVKFREAKLAAARTRMEAAKKKLEQNKKLFEVGGIIKSKLDQVELEYQNAVEELKAAQVELDSAKYELEKTYLQSPIDGVLISKDAEEGEYVTTSTQVATVGEIRKLYVEMGIIEKDIERVQLGQKLTLKVDTYPDDEFKGEIDNIFPAVQGKSRTITVRGIVENPENKLLPGMFARCSITVYERENAIIVPPLAIDKTEEGYQVFVIDKDNKIHKTMVDVEYTGNPEYWVVAEGVKPGEVVVKEVVSAQRSQLKDGMKVEVIETEEYTF